LNFPKFVGFLGHFLKQQCFWKMGVADIGRLPCPSKMASFSGNLNVEALLKVSYRNIYWLEIYKSLKSKIIKKAQFHKENGIKNNFPLQSFVFLKPVNIFVFRRASPLRFPEGEAILDGRGNCVMPATTIFQKHCFFMKCLRNLTNFAKFKFFCISCCNFIGLFNGVSFVFVLLVVWAVQSKR